MPSKSQAPVKPNTGIRTYLQVTNQEANFVKWRKNLKSQWKKDYTAYKKGRELPPSPPPKDEEPPDNQPVTNTPPASEDDDSKW